MTERTQYGNLQVSKLLDDLLTKEILPGLNVSSEQFWSSFNQIIEEFTPRNRSLILCREKLQENAPFTKSGLFLVPKVIDASK